MRRKKPEASEEGRSCNFGRNIGKGTVKKKETYKAGKDRCAKAEFGQRLETNTNTL